MTLRTAGATPPPHRLIETTLQKLRPKVDPLSAQRRQLSRLLAAPGNLGDTGGPPVLSHPGEFSSVGSMW